MGTLFWGRLSSIDFEGGKTLKFVEADLANAHCGRFLGSLSAPLKDYK